MKSAKIAQHQKALAVGRVWFYLSFHNDPRLAPEAHYERDSH